MTSDAQKKAVKKYKQKVNRITIDFSPAEAELWEHIQKQEKKQTYIKDLIRADIEKQNSDIKEWISAGTLSDMAKCPHCGKMCGTLNYIAIVGGDFCPVCGKKVRSIQTPVSALMDGRKKK